MNNKWTREETIIAFNIYCKIPYGSISTTNPRVIEYANILNRTPNSLVMKLCNIARLDSDQRDRGVSGLTHGAKMEQIVWDEFVDNPDRLAFESEKLIARMSDNDIESSAGILTDDLLQGSERYGVVKQRVNQSFFRAAVLSSYNFKCCISGINTLELLETCHIVDWAEDTENRTNPKNGLCMNPFFHKAYDKLLVGISPDLKISISERLLQGQTKEPFIEYLKNLNGRQIIKPTKFYPQKELLDKHFQQYLSQQ